jgi:hypothetical protein
LALGIAIEAVTATLGAALDTVPIPFLSKIVELTKGAYDRVQAAKDKAQLVAFLAHLLERIQVTETRVDTLDEQRALFSAVLRDNHAEGMTLAAVLSELSLPAFQIALEIASVNEEATWDHLSNPTADQLFALAQVDKQSFKDAIEELESHAYLKAVRVIGGSSQFGIALIQPYWNLFWKFDDIAIHSDLDADASAIACALADLPEHDTIVPHHFQTRLGMPPRRFNPALAMAIRRGWCEYSGTLTNRAERYGYGSLYANAETRKIRRAVNSGASIR